MWLSVAVGCRRCDFVVMVVDGAAVRGAGTG